MNTVAVVAAGGQGLTIDWTKMPTYNTIMSVAVGAGLLTVVWLFRELRARRIDNWEGWALAFGVPGVILFATGLHMTLTWPMAAYFPFDNIIFGETSLALGTLLAALAMYLWRRGAILAEAPDPLAVVSAAMRPLSVFFVGMGLALIALMAAGLSNQLFAAPPEEPLTGTFAQWPWLEATFMSLLLGFTGLATLVTPIVLSATARGRSAGGWARAWTWLTGLTGLVYLLFGALNFFTHIGLIVNTMPQ